MRSIFIQRSRLGKLVFEHDGLVLHVFGRHLGSLVDRQYLLKNISPNFRCVQKHIHGPVYFFSALAALLLFAVKLLRASLPPDVANAWIHLFFVWIPTSLVGVVYWWAPFLFIRFPVLGKSDDMVIICERRQRAECEEFIAGLIFSIENPGQVLAPDDSNEHLLNFSSGKGIGWRTLTSLICGGLGVGLPWIGLNENEIGGLIFMVVFLCSVGAVAFGVWAWDTKEPKWPVAIAGVLLGIIPPFVYM